MRVVCLEYKHVLWSWYIYVLWWRDMRVIWSYAPHWNHCIACLKLMVMIIQQTYHPLFPLNLILKTHCQHQCMFEAKMHPILKQGGARGIREKDCSSSVGYHIVIGTHELHTYHQAQHLLGESAEEIRWGNPLRRPAETGFSYAWAWGSLLTSMIRIHACTMITGHTCTMIIALARYAHSRRMYYGHSTCMYYDHSTCMDSDNGTCMSYQPSTCMYYDLMNALITEFVHVLWSEYVHALWS